MLGFFPFDFAQGQNDIPFVIVRGLGGVEGLISRVDSLLGILLRA